MGTVMADCFVTKMGMAQGAALTLAVAVAIVANISYSLIFNVLMPFWAPLIDRAAASGDGKKLALCHFSGAVVMNLGFVIPTFLAFCGALNPWQTLSTSFRRQ